MKATNATWNGASVARKFPNKTIILTPGTPPPANRKTPFILSCCRSTFFPMRGGWVSHRGASPGPAYPPRQLNVLLHDGDPLGVDGAQVDVLEEMDKEGLGGFLKGLDRL